MVFYECVLTAKNTAPFMNLTNLMKTVSLKVVERGGIVRSVQNHGIRDLPHRFKAKYPDKEGNRYYKKGRFISVFYDASPHAREEVQAILDLDEEVLRNTHLKPRNKVTYANIVNEKKNPYIQRVRAMEEAEAAARKEEHVEVISDPDAQTQSA
uniref:Ribosomal protein S6 n=2 Tax=Bacillariophyta TaxID=2836 RepID=A0A6T7JZ88_9STRA|mmetsp:Transcript_6985/g.12541  ORF Transcript_6985/g.12541 Transcript_6985/m.12541 type:complete len:154 (+) Transcript_6985:178-639(+)|eukprot:CAMPEP_0198293944 /NCGR_PEP_ID=MMETSP1449-20131203/19680_1 /TAXON_ID=420275 /ORGANISM="Attheya septentrionalis, Strain CCMP2084" /LENGTH=153 /DNA_ID=CAMNT_0043993711 /DNA_START=146 /DNA_END=607 /DNA_ORIENTATION=+